MWIDRMLSKLPFNNKKTLLGFLTLLFGKEYAELLNELFPYLDQIFQYGGGLYTVIGAVHRIIKNVKRE